MKRALVLSGGGSRGAYQAGAYKALQEAGYQFDIVVGTSIGALNGALIAQKDIDFMYQLWENMDVTQVMNHVPDIEFSFDSLIENRNKIATFLSGYVKEKGADTTPLQTLIRNQANMQKIKENHVQYGCVVTSYPSLTGLEISLEEMQENDFPEYLIASSACFPAFPMHTINGKEYIDGGYYDNTPIQFATRLGAEEIIVIELGYPKIEHPTYEKFPNILTIRPSRSTDSILNFNKEHLKELLTLGYLDALRALKKCKGTTYTIEELHEDKINRIANNFSLSLQQADIQQGNKKVISIKSRSPFSDEVKEIVNYTNNEDYVLYFLEKCAQHLHIDPFTRYTFDTLVKKLIEPYQSLESYQIQQFLPNLLSNLPNLKDELSTIDTSFLFGVLISKILDNDSSDLLVFLPFIKEQVICAFFIATLLKEEQA